MSNNSFKRRDFIKTLLSGIAVTSIDWNSFPKVIQTIQNKNQFDAIIIGAGLGGLSCGAAFARQGFKPLVLEQHTKPGGYATTFTRNDFTFDVSLHSTSVGERNGLHNLINGFPEITDVEFVPHPDLYRVIYPDYDIRVPQKNLATYMEMLIKYFPEEKSGIEGIFEDMKGISNNIIKLSGQKGKPDMSTFPTEYPYLFKSFGKPWGDLVNARITNPKLRAIVSSQWGYYGLPPSKLSPYYYALPCLSYLTEGGYYPIGRSQKISDALTKIIRERGGTVQLGSRVKEILIKDHTAVGVKTENGEEYTARVVVSNASANSTFSTMMHEDDFLKDYLQKMSGYSVSLSCFQVFLGLKTDLIKKVGIKDSEIFYNTGYDPDADYLAMKNANIEDGGYGLSLYDNIYKDYSPKGKNTINILVLQGYDHWQKFENDYLNGKKDEYNKEKKRIADVMIDNVEKTLLPGLRDAIEVIEIGTPLTNIHYTGNYHGAVYGWDQTLNNSGNSRIGHKTPIKNLYLAGAWTKPGHGYGAVIPSGLECFGEIMKEW
jgi:all-trans-retinol 13,14-reductase